MTVGARSTLCRRLARVNLSISRLSNISRMQLPADHLPTWQMAANWRGLPGFHYELKPRRGGHGHEWMAMYIHLEEVLIYLSLMGGECDSNFSGV